MFATLIGFLACQSQALPGNAPLLDAHHGGTMLIAAVSELKALLFPGGGRLSGVGHSRGGTSPFCVFVA